MTKPTKAAPDQGQSNLLGCLGGSLWLWVAGAFCVLILVWVVLFTVAHRAKVESVPLATKGGRP